MVATAHGSDSGGVAASGLAAQITALFHDIGTMIDAVAAADPQSGAEATKRLSALKIKNSTRTRRHRSGSNRGTLGALRPTEATPPIGWSWICTRRSTGSLPPAPRRMLAGARVYGLTAERPAAGRSLHARPRPHPRPQVRSSGPRYHGHAFRRPAWSSKTTSARPTRMCWSFPLKPLTSTVTYTDVHRAAREILHRAVRPICGRVERARPRSRRGTGRRRRLLSDHRPLHGRQRRGPRCLSGIDRHVAGIPDRLEQGAQKPAHLAGRRRSDAAILDWAARQRIGHRGFLELRRRRSGG